MFHIGLTEWVLLAIIALFLIGPEKLPKMAQIIGRFINELKRAVDSMTVGHFTKEPTDTTHTIKQLSKSSVTSIETDKSETSSSENKITPHT